MKAKIYIMLGIIVLILTVPLGFCAVVLGSLMCIKQPMSARCTLVASVPEIITALIGIVLLGHGIALRWERDKHDQQNQPDGG